MFIDLHAVNSIPLTRECASIAAALGVEKPEFAEASEPILDEFFSRRLGGKPAERALLYNPDAVGSWLMQKYTSDFAPLLARTELAMPYHTMLPSVTPVCFGTMYTGAAPAVHGITEYRKPVIKIDTLFDSLIRAGKRVALVAEEGSSMASIWLERDMDYFIVPDDDAAMETAVGLLEADRHDVVVVYQAMYDTMMHKLGVEAVGSLRWFRESITRFAKLYDIAAAKWSDKSWIAGYMPDHGCHNDENERGQHGTDHPEDLNINHFYSAR